MLPPFVGQQFELASLRQAGILVNPLIRPSHGTSGRASCQLTTSTQFGKQPAQATVHIRCPSRHLGPGGNVAQIMTKIRGYRHGLDAMGLARRLVPKVTVEGSVGRPRVGSLCRQHTHNPVFIPNPFRPPNVTSLGGALAIPVNAFGVG